jgi:serine/threonine protein kinase
MEDSLLFVLPDDVEFIPVSSIDHKTKAHFQYEEDDVVITHFNTRKSSKVIDPYSAGLLKEFKSPKSWAEVIFQFAHANNKDPQEVAEEAYQLLVDMHQNGFLVPYKPVTTTGTKSLFEINDRFKGYVISEKKRMLDDTEVYFGQDDSGKNYVLKFIKKLNDDEIPNEIRILKMLDGRVNLPLIEEGRYQDSHYMITEWFESLLCKEEADRYRNYYSRDNVIKQLDLCINILFAYRHLHQQGILQGDVNDENILVSPSGAIKIIDYNMAVTGGEKMEVREGVCYYYEPELAASRINNEEDHPSTAKGEQYAIATILYLILAGRHYIEFSVEKEKLYHQILQEGPVPFSACDLNLPNELDDIFARALTKDPSNRFASLDDFAAAFIKIRHDIFSDNKYFVTGKSHSEDRFLQFMTDTYGWQSSLLKKGFLLPPTCSVNFGAAGIAYMFYRMACIREDTHLLDLADVWANRAEVYQSNYGKAFYADEIEINEATVGKNSLYHGPAGIHLVGCLINSGKGDHASLYHSLDQYLKTSKEPTDKIDVALGKAGLLVGFAILYKDMKALRQFDFNPIIQSANKIMNELWDILDQYPGVTQKNKVDYFGIAHGWAGLLYATLYWCSVSGQDLPKQFMNRVEEMQDGLIENKSMIYWPVTITETRPWTGWCNGSAGHIFLWSLLYRYFKEQKYLDIAERTAQHVLQDARSKIYNLCCGTAGHAYALVSLYNLTGEKKWLEHAMNVKQRILDNLSFPSERINSLYKSMPGAAVLFCELERPELARMPLFE